MLLVTKALFSIQCTLTILLLLSVSDTRALNCTLLTVISCFLQCCGSKYIEFGSGSRILAQFGSGSGIRVILSILKEKIKNDFIEKLFSLKTV